MYRYIVATLMLVVFVVLIEPAKTLMSSLLRLDQPIKHQIEEGDWFSKLAQKHYGDSSFGKELALLNRAPDGNLIFPGEEIVIPSFEKIQQIRQTQRLSVVNAIADEQIELAAGNVPPAPPVAESEPIEETGSAETLTSEPVTPEGETAPAPEMPAQGDQGEEPLTESYALDESPENSETESSALIIGGIVLFVIAVGAGIAFWVRKKREREDVDTYGASEEEEEREASSIYFDRFEKDDDREDDENGKKKKKSDKAEVVA